jgi:hypothetical protein
MSVVYGSLGSHLKFGQWITASKQIKRQQGNSARESHQYQVRIRIVGTLLALDNSESQGTVKMRMSIFIALKTLRPFQNTLSIELDAMPERIAAGKLATIYEDDTLTCHCRFARRYLLPCRHVFPWQRSKDFDTREVGFISLYLESQGTKCMRRWVLSKWEKMGVDPRRFGLSVRTNANVLTVSCFCDIIQQNSNPKVCSCRSLPPSPNKNELNFS